MSDAEFVQVIVGGLFFSVALSDIEKYPGSFFECMVKKEWLTDQQTPITIERDGALFKYIYSFLVTDYLPRDNMGRIALDENTLQKLKIESDFFGLEALSTECDIPRKRLKSELEVIVGFRQYVRDSRLLGKEDNIEIECSSAFVQSLKAAWAPFCLTNNDIFYENDQAYKAFVNSSLYKLVDIVDQAPKGGSSDPSTPVNNLISIPASVLNDDSRLIARQIHLDDFAPHMHLELRLNKLSVVSNDITAHANAAMRDEGHIGILEVILDSDYTGGELEVSHSGRMETVTGAYSWVAMYNDCQYKINPVTSGTRVSLIYDIFGTVRDSASTTTRREDEAGPENEYGDALTEKELFWNGYYYKSIDSSPDKLRGIDQEQEVAIQICVDVELTRVDSVIITLQHLYPETENYFDFLDGGDRALYDCLIKQYDVQVVTVTIHRCYGSTYCYLFSSVIPDPCMDDSTDDSTDDCAQAPFKKRRMLSNRTKLVTPMQFNENCLLDCNIATNEYFTMHMYAVTCLQVKRNTV